MGGHSVFWEGLKTPQDPPWRRHWLPQCRNITHTQPPLYLNALFFSLVLSLSSCDQQISLIYLFTLPFLLHFLAFALYHYS